MTSEMAALTRRVQTLENQNKRLQRGAAALCLAMTIVLLMGQARPAQKILTAQGFALTDAAGNVRGEFAFSGGKPHLWLTDSEVPEVMLTANSDGGGLTFRGSGGEPRALLQSTKDGAVLNLWQRDGKGRVHLGAGSVDFRNVDPKTKYLVVYGDVPGPSVVIEDEKKFSAVIGSANMQTPETGQELKSSAAALHLFNKDGQLIWSAPE